MTHDGSRTQACGHGLEGSSCADFLPSFPLPTLPFSVCPLSLGSAWKADGVREGQPMSPNPSESGLSGSAQPGAPAHREERCSLEATGCDCRAGHAAAASKVQTYTDSCHQGDGRFRGTLRGPELACADQGPNLALGVPLAGLTPAPASLLRGSDSSCPSGHFPCPPPPDPFPACLSTPDVCCPQLWDSYQALNSPSWETGPAIVCVSGRGQAQPLAGARNVHEGILEFTQSTLSLRSRAGTCPSTTPRPGTPAGIDPHHLPVPTFCPNPVLPCTTWEEGGRCILAACHVQQLLKHRVARGL